MDLQKIKDALNECYECYPLVIGIEDSEEENISHDSIHGLGNIKRAILGCGKALAELEKSIDDTRGECDDLSKEEMWNTIQEIRTFVVSDGTKSIISDIETFAESYHLKQCEACKKNMQNIINIPCINNKQSI